MPDTPAVVVDQKAPAVVPPAAVPAAPAAATPAPAARFLGDGAPVKPETPAAPVADALKPDAAKPAEWTLAAPKDVTVAPEALKAAETFAKENGLTQVQAEKMLARDLAAQTESAKASEARTAQVGQTWHEQTMADPVIGGANYEKTLENANKALALYPEAIRKAIVTSEFRKNPILLHILNERGKAIPVEDIHVQGGDAPPASKSPAERIYGRR